MATRRANLLASESIDRSDWFRKDYGARWSPRRWARLDALLGGRSDGRFDRRGSRAHSDLAPHRPACFGIGVGGFRTRGRAVEIATLLVGLRHVRQRPHGGASARRHGPQASGRSRTAAGLLGRLVPWGLPLGWGSEPWAIRVPSRRRDCRPLLELACRSGTLGGEHARRDRRHGSMRSTSCPHRLSRSRREPCFASSPVHWR